MKTSVTTILPRWLIKTGQIRHVNTKFTVEYYEPHPQKPEIVTPPENRVQDTEDVKMLEEAVDWIGWTRVAGLLKYNTGSLDQPLK